MENIKWQKKYGITGSEFEDDMNVIKKIVLEVVSIAI